MTSIMELEERISRSISLQVEMSVKLISLNIAGNPATAVERARLTHQVIHVGAWLTESIALLATARAGGSLDGY